MTPGELQAFNQAVALINQGMRKAAHPILVNLAQNNPTEPNLLFWLVYSSSEASQAQQYLNRLVALDPYNPSIAAAHDWIANPANFPVSAPVSVAPVFSYAGVTSGSASVFTAPVKPVPRVRAWLIEKKEKKSYFGGRVFWRVELEGQEYRIDLKHNNLTQRKRISLDQTPLKLRLPTGVLLWWQHEDCPFEIGNTQSVVRINPSFNFKPPRYSLIVNNIEVETGDELAMNTSRWRATIPWEAYFAGIICVVGTSLVFRSIPTWICSMVAFGFCWWLGRNPNLHTAIRVLLLSAVCAVFFWAMFLIFKVPPYPYR